MSKTDKWTGKIALLMLSIIIALLGFIWNDLQADIADNKTTSEVNGAHLIRIDSILIGGGYEKKMIQGDVSDNATHIAENKKRIEQIEKELP